MPNEPAKTSATVKKAFRVLEVLSESGGMGVSECARKIGYNKSTTHRLLRTLQELRLVQKDHASERYVLGPRLFELAQGYSPQQAFIDAAESQLRELVEETGETVNLAVPDGGKCLYIRTIEGLHSVRMTGRPGRHDPLHSTAVGKAMLAFLPSTEQERILAAIPLTKRTPNTVTNKRELLRQLKLIAERGFAVDDQEEEEGTTCVGVAIRNASGLPIAAISVAGPYFRLPPERLQEVGAAALRAAQKIEASPLPNHISADWSILSEATESPILP